MPNARVKTEVPKYVNVRFPIYLQYKSCEDEEDSHAVMCEYSEYWKIESLWKITVIQEDSVSMSVITYRNKEEDAFYNNVTEDMINEENGWKIVQEHVYDESFNRLIDKVTTA